MPKSWRLTRQAEDALLEIAQWTLETFGPRQAAAYEEDLINRCEAIAQGMAHTQSCQQIIDPNLPEGIRFARAGAHLIIFVAIGDEVVVIDFLHAKNDLPRRIAELVASKEH